MRAFCVHTILLIIFSQHLISQGCKPQVYLGDTIAFCEGNSITISAYNPNCTYVWNTGATTATITINSPGVYWVNATNSCGSTLDSVYVGISEPIFLDLGPDIILCTSDSIGIKRKFGVSYLWSNGSTNSKVPVNQSGSYWLKASNECNTATDTIYVNVDSPLNINLGPDTLICTNASQSITIPYAQHILWSTGDTHQSININNGL